ncbi:MAG TPA: methyltransferase domain-containing protein [Kouleothrix sp.]|jgi:SAM-dependent methyltransferase|nr:methyltransferase domain-containing protein [Kouleothrix sp.]
MEMKTEYYNWHQPDQTRGDILRAIRNAEQVLDLGCGTGWIVQACRSAGIASVGLDIDLHALQLAPNPEPLVCGSVTALPFACEAFDAVVAKDILEHLLHPGQAIKEIWRVLRPNGVLWISTPHAGSRRFYDDYTHVRPFTLQSLRSLLDDYGFTLHTFFYSGAWPGMGWFSRRRGYDGIEPIVKMAARMGLRRDNIHVIAFKR